MNLNEIKKKFNDHILNLQKGIISKMSELDSSLVVKEDNWKRIDFIGQDGGGGKTRAITGDLFENAGVNTSLIWGEVDPDFSKKLGQSSNNLWASGISLIIHPKNPKIPTVHANFRMIHAGDKFWFGGGADLTPFYPFEEDFKYFHDVWKKACEPFDCYEQMKKNCDEYFVNTHRDSEMRGIGGLFFDHLNSGDIDYDFEKVIHLSNHFIESYFPIVEKRQFEKWDKEDEDFQLHRRGRYVEFNLLHDRGTHFGLKSNGRTDSILISLPARCNFTYMYRPKPNSVHEKMLQFYYPHNW